MQTETRTTDYRRPQLPLGANRRYAWKERVYPVPNPTRKGFQIKASALRGVQRWKGGADNPVSVVVPALVNFMPAESIALGWLNDLGALRMIRQRIMAASKVTGWDVFTFHTQHNLDHFFDSTIAAVRDTWVKEGRLSQECVRETRRRYRNAYDYHRAPARLVENLVFQSSLMDWLSERAEAAPLRYHVVGTALVSALVWSGSISLETAIETLSGIGSRWDSSLTTLVEDELKRDGLEGSEENVGWLRFHKVRQIVEGHAPLSLAVALGDLPQVEAPARSFSYSPTATDKPISIATVSDVRDALRSMNICSWSPGIPETISDGQVRGWLASPLHPVAGSCRWSYSNYLLATPESAMMFLDHIAAASRAYGLPIEAAVASPRRLAEV